MNQIQKRPPPNALQKFLSKYSYIQKINVIGALLTFVTILISYLLASTLWREIEFGNKEIKGNNYQRAVYELMDSLSLYNIYADDNLPQKELYQNKLPQLQSTIESDFQNLISINSAVQKELKVAPQDFRIREEINTHPEELYSKWKNLKENEQYQLMTALPILMQHIADSSNMSYDPEVETHYLMKTTTETLPKEKELLLQILLLGNKIQLDGIITSQEKFQLTNLVSILNASVNISKASINKSIIEEANLNKHVQTKNRLSPSLKEYLASIRSFITYIQQEVLNLNGESDQTTLTKEQSATLSSLGISAIEQNNVLWNTLSEEIETLLTSRVDSLSQERLAIIAIVFLSLLLAAIGGYIILSETNYFFKNVYIAVVNFAEGELSSRAPPSYDTAFESMRKVLNEIADRIEDLIEHLQQSGVQLTTTATQITAAAKHQEGTVCQQEATVKQILVTAGEISSTAKEFARTMNDVSHAAEETSSLASHGKEELSSMEVTMKQMVNASKNIASKLSVLSEKAGAITSVITTITKVADQTNLLSLNASIEAEKAGEHGKSFAVIAREIRRLADQTANATLDIEQMVSEMMSAVSEGVMGVDKFSEEIRRGVNQVSTASEQLSQIINQVQQQTTHYENVNKGMQAQSLGAEQINESIMQLSDAAQETTNSIRQFHTAIDQLTFATKDMQTCVARMKK